jgi:chorismate-pyruvate lyase
MLRNNTAFLVNELIDLGDSTTFFLELVKGERLQVTVQSQEETGEGAERLIRRVVSLYFRSQDAPVLYCSSELKVSMLTDREYTGLKEGTLPIGRLFNSLNTEMDIRKNNIYVRQVRNPALAALLNVRSTNIFEKRYEYRVGDRLIGHISEFFNEESLERL